VRVIFGLTVIGGIGLLWLAVWPGMIEDAVFGFPLFCLSLPVLGFWFLMLIGLAVRDIISRPEKAGRRQWWGALSAGIMFGTLGLLGLHVPQRISFSFCHTDLRNLVDTAPVEEFRGTELGRRVGPYKVDRYGADPRGGVFFRTAGGPDGIGPNQMSYGFAFRPNREGSPFGDSNYRVRHLFDDWYVFAVSDD